MVSRIGFYMAFETGLPVGTSFPFFVLGATQYQEGSSFSKVTGVLDTQVLDIAAGQDCCGGLHLDCLVKWSKEVK